MPFENVRLVRQVRVLQLRVKSMQNKPLYSKSKYSQLSDARAELLAEVRKDSLKAASARCFT
eukprot:10013779-Alexandrium_andersonii.AAC.1